MRHVATYLGLNVAVLAPGGGPGAAPTSGTQGLPGSLDGEFFTTDKVTIAAGRMADPAAPARRSSTPRAYRLACTWARSRRSASSPTPSCRRRGRAAARPYLTVNVKIVGEVAYSSEEAQDDVDVQRDGGALFTPALTRLLARCCAALAETAVQLRPPATVASAEAAIQGVLPKGFPIEFYVAAQTEARAGRAIEPTSIALAVFGSIAALAALIIAGQVIGRQLRRDPADLAAMRALARRRPSRPPTGCPASSPPSSPARCSPPPSRSLSPLAPLGAVRAVYPYPGVAFDWTVLGGGAAVIIAALTATALVIATRRAPHHAAAGGGPSRSLGSRAARSARALRLPGPAAEGIRLALDSGAELDRAPVRPAILAAVLASVVMLATITFGASLGTLVAHPALYGWNWTYALSSGQVVIDRAGRRRARPRPRRRRLVGHLVRHRADRRTDRPGDRRRSSAAVAPPVLSGRALDGSGQLVLGPQTLAALGERVGGTVTVTDGAPHPYTLRIGGTATLRAMGIASTMHTEMGSGAIVPYQDIPGADAAQPNAILVSLRPGADLARQQAVLQRISRPPTAASSAACSGPPRSPTTGPWASRR